MIRFCHKNVGKTYSFDDLLFECTFQVIIWLNYLQKKIRLSEKVENKIDRYNVVYKKNIEPIIIFICIKSMTISSKLYVNCILRE